MRKEGWGRKERKGGRKTEEKEELTALCQSIDHLFVLKSKEFEGVGFRQH